MLSSWIQVPLLPSNERSPKKEKSIGIFWIMKLLIDQQFLTEIEHLIARLQGNKKSDCCGWCKYLHYFSRLWCLTLQTSTWKIISVEPTQQVTVHSKFRVILRIWFDIITSYSTTMIVQNSIFITNLFQIESFGSWACLLKLKKHPTKSRHRLSNEVK